MRLNIETTNAYETLKILKQVFIDENVLIVGEYDESADYLISQPDADDGCQYVYSAESIFELAAVIPPHKVRIY